MTAICPNAKSVHKNSLCFMEKIIFQLLSCLYLYDSGIPVPVCVRKQSQYTGDWPVALIYRAAGIPEIGGGVDIPCPRYTGIWRCREVCAKPVYRHLASKGLIRDTPRFSSGGSCLCRLARLAKIQADLIHAATLRYTSGNCIFRLALITPILSRSNSCYPLIHYW